MDGCVWWADMWHSPVNHSAFSLHFDFTLHGIYTNPVFPLPET